MSLSISLFTKIDKNIERGQNAPTSILTEIINSFIKMKLINIVACAMATLVLAQEPLNELVDDDFITEQPTNDEQSTQGSD